MMRTDQIEMQDVKLHADTGQLLSSFGDIHEAIMSICDSNQR